MYGKGISREGSVIDLGVELGIVKKAGAWFTYEGEQLGQGREKAKEFLASSPELMVEITDKVMRKAGIGEGAVVAEGLAEAEEDADIEA
jgi:recombination protein RecA